METPGYNDRFLTYNYWNGQSQEYLIYSINQFKKINKINYIEISEQIIACWLWSLDKNFKEFTNKEDKKVMEEKKANENDMENRIQKMTEFINNHGYPKEMNNALTSLAIMVAQSNTYPLNEEIRKETIEQSCITMGMLTEIKFKFEEEKDGYSELKVVYDINNIQQVEANKLIVSYLNLVILETCYRRDLFIMTEPKVAFDGRYFLQEFSINAKEEEKIRDMLTYVQGEIHRGINFIKLYNFNLGKKG